MASFEGKTAFITGAGSGIGRASSQAVAKAGGKVMLIDIDPAGLQETAELVAAAGGDVAYRVVDIADDKAVRQAVQETVSHFGGLHLAHNNAAVLGSPAPMVGYPLEQAKRLFDVNVFGLLSCMQAQIAHMLENGGGRIVNTASVSGFRASPGLSLYTASKHAVIGLTRSAAFEYSGQKIGVNCVCPGYVRTKMVQNTLDPEVEKAIASHIPIGRVAEPEDVAKATVWLLSEDSAYLSGDCMVIDGAYSTY
jgi:NAD(P)-dependent dehydrogenase (short-subunit alcohol dehydrogenase family)